MHWQSRRGAAALPPQAAPPEAPNTATERRARLRLRKASGGREVSPTAHPPQCYGRGRLVGFRGDRLCLVLASCASEGGGPWVPSAASDACVPKRGYLRGCNPLGPFFPPFLSVQKGGPRRIGEWRLRHQKTSFRNELCAAAPRRAGGYMGGLVPAPRVPLEKTLALW